jgi:hypothetical protein
MPFRGIWPAVVRGAKFADVMAANAGVLTVMPFKLVKTGIPNPVQVSPSVEYA